MPNPTEYCNTYHPVWSLYLHILQVVVHSLSREYLYVQFWQHILSYTAASDRYTQCWQYINY